MLACFVGIVAFAMLIVATGYLVICCTRDLFQNLFGQDPNYALVMASTASGNSGSMSSAGQPWYEEQKARQIREVADFRAREERDTPKIRKEFEAATIDGSKVVEVGDLVWWPQTDATILLAAVQLENGKFMALGYDNGKFAVPEASCFSWALDNLTALPQIKLGDDCIEVWFATERYIMADHGYSNEEARAGNFTRRWR